MKNFLKIKIKNKKGYTIIETMIAISLFVVIVMTGMGVLLNASALHQKSGDMRSIIDSLSFVLDDISRNLRTGTNYHCVLSGDSEAQVLSDVPRNCIGNSAGIGISFKNSLTNQRQAYYIANDSIFKLTQEEGESPVLVQMTPDNIIISSQGDSSVFKVFNSEIGGGQPFATIKLSGEINYKNITTPFTVQTSVSQRLLDIGL